MDRSLKVFTAALIITLFIGEFVHCQIGPKTDGSKDSEGIAHLIAFSQNNVANERNLSKNGCYQTRDVLAFRGPCPNCLTTYGSS
jgi:hypothetical protein